MLQARDHTPSQQRMSHEHILQGETKAANLTSSKLQANSRVTLPTCPVLPLSPSFPPGERLPLSLCHLQSSHRLPSQPHGPNRVKHPSLLNTHSGAGMQIRSGCRRLARRGYNSLEIPFRHGALKGGTQKDCGATNQQHSMRGQ